MNRVTFGLIVAATILGAWLFAQREFHGIRQKNLREVEAFGDGTHAPHWDRNGWSSHEMLCRGVWVDDSAKRPSNRELDAFRETYWRDHEVVRYTLIEGEQLAPMGKDHAMIRVRATAGAPMEVTDGEGHHVSSWPTVSIQQVDSADGWPISVFNSSLPAEMSYVRKRGELPPSSPR